MIIFETKRLTVRTFSKEYDVDNFFRINGDPEVMHYIRAVKSKEECEVFLMEQIENYKKYPKQGRWAVEEKLNGKFVGSFAFIPIEGSEDMQLGYALLKEFWGKGMATELMMEGIQYVFSKTTLKEIFAITEAANMSSQKVLLKTGFLLEKIHLEDGKEVCRFILKRSQA